MKSLTEFVIQEGLSDNIFYLLDTWFGNRTNEIEEFTNICSQCAGNKSTSTEKVKELIAGTELEKNLQPFVNFIQGEVKMPKNSNYHYLLGKIIDAVTANQKKDNRYTTKKDDMVVPKEITGKEIVKTKPEDPSTVKQSPKTARKFKDIAPRKVELLVPQKVEAI